MTTPVKRSSWIVPLVACIAAFAVLAAVDAWFAEYVTAAGFVAFALVAVGFLWTYVTDAERMWWAIIPSLGALTLMAAMAADLVIGTDPSNDWASVAVFGLGAAIIGLALRRTEAKTVLYVIAMFGLSISALMAPITAGVQIVLIAIVVVVGIYVILRTGGRLPSTKSHGGLTPRA